MRIDLKRVQENFGPHVSLHKLREGLYEIHFPMYAEDGDPLPLYIRADKQNMALTDLGITLMRLSYEVDITTESRIRTFQEIVRQNGLEEQDGEVFLEVKNVDIYPELLQFAQAVAKIGSMRFFQREIASNLFYENVQQVVQQKLDPFNPREQYVPLKEQKEFVVDFALLGLPTPAYIFAVRTSNKAREATICLLHFLKHHLQFQGVVVYESYLDLPKKDFRWLSSAADKQFLDFADFEENSARYFGRFKQPFAN